MGEIFDPTTGVDFAITATNPDVAFDTEGPLSNTFGGIIAGAGNNGKLTFPANLYGNPAISIPAGFVDELPVGLQVVGKHHRKQLLLDVGVNTLRLASVSTAMMLCARSDYTQPRCEPLA